MLPILVIYTGGTIGMKPNVDGAYAPTQGFLSLLQSVVTPNSLTNLPKHDYIEITPAIDSSCITPNHWQKIANLIIEKQANYRSFVILHGTDTMVYSAAILAFLLNPLKLSIVMTGSQIPLVETHSDGLSNLLGALQVADDDIVHELCLYFNHKLMRATRIIKASCEKLSAFDSPNFPLLAKFENKLKYFPENFLNNKNNELSATTNQPIKLNNNTIALIYLTPFMPMNIIDDAINSGIKGLVITSYGSGNIAMDNQELLQSLANADKKQIVMLNVTQCQHGSVNDNYEAAQPLAKLNVIGGKNMTIAAATAKLYYLLNTESDIDIIRKKLTINLQGELD